MCFTVYRPLLAFFVCALGACSSQPVRDERVNPARAVPQQTPPQTSFRFEDFKKTVGLQRPRTQLGYIEKAFDGCGVQFGLESGQCERSLLVSVQFRLMCRDSEGTVSVAIAPEDLEPVANQTLAWAIKGVNGEIQTDSEGYGEILFISPISQRQQRLKLSNGTDFLYLNAGEVSRLVTPVTWCSSPVR